MKVKYRLANKDQNPITSVPLAQMQGHWCSRGTYSPAVIVQATMTHRWVVSMDSGVSWPPSNNLIHLKNTRTNKQTDWHWQTCLVGGWWQSWCWQVTPLAPCQLSLNLVEAPILLQPSLFRALVPHLKVWSLESKIRIIQMQNSSKL